MPLSLKFRHRCCQLTIGFGLSAVLAMGAPAHAGLFDVSPSKERKMGDDAAQAIESQTRIVTGPVAEWVQRIGARLAAVSQPDFEYSFQVIDSPEINAFALPGGYVYVYTGLRKVAQTDDELAAVLAHEITHAEQHHYAKQYKKATKRGALLSVFSVVAGLPGVAQNVLGILDYSMTQKYSRSQESEADRLGMQRMKRAGFDPHGMVTLLEKLAKEDPGTSRLDRWFGDHPDGPGRVRDAQKELSEMGLSPSPGVMPASSLPQPDKTNLPVAANPGNDPVGHAPDNDNR